ncbi:DinB family protein [Hymenobacter sp. BRD67]|nr:DinB family protein [Hymenobacter sp. BRD67]
MPGRCATRWRPTTAAGSWQASNIVFGLCYCAWHCACRACASRCPYSAAPPAPATIAPLPELRAEWAGVRRQLEQVLHEFPGTKLNHTVFRHPRAGWLTIGQTVASVLDHTLHHQQQLNRISKVLKK